MKEKMESWLSRWEEALWSNFRELYLANSLKWVAPTFNHSSRFSSLNPQSKTQKDGLLLWYWKHCKSELPTLFLQQHSRLENSWSRGSHNSQYFQSTFSQIYLKLPNTTLSSTSTRVSMRNWIVPLLKLRKQRSLTSQWCWRSTALSVSAMIQADSSLQDIWTSNQVLQLKEP